MHGHPFEAFVPAISQTARFCGMRWVEPPIVVHGAHRVSDEELRDAAEHYRRRLDALASEVSPQQPRTEPQVVERPMTEHGLLVEAMIYLAARRGVRAAREPPRARLGARLPDRRAA